MSPQTEPCKLYAIRTAPGQPWQEAVRSRNAWHAPATGAFIAYDQHVIEALPLEHNCQACVATFGPDNALPAVVVIRSTINKHRPRYLCEEHAWQHYIKFASDRFVYWRDCILDRPIPEGFQIE